MASNERRPVFIPPKKRAAKKLGETATPARVHCYDVITSIPGEDYKSKPFRECSSSQSPHHETAFASNKQSPDSTVNPKLFVKDECDFLAARKSESTEKIETLNSDNVTELTVLNKQSCSSQDSPSVSFENNDIDIEASEKLALNDGKVSESNYITMTGTIKRGKKAGQSVDICLNMSREELENLEAAIISQTPETKKKTWSIRSGLHIFVWTILCLPFIAIAAGAYSFYMGTITWYNVYLYFSEEKTLWHKICFCPLLILFYPFYIIIVVIGLALFAAVVQVSWNYDVWLCVVQDLEKGFYGWLCASLGLDDCSPYEVVILNDTATESEGVKFPVADTVL